jgi:ubiquinone/menaquinone biosynthesis C-methylase UbiE
MVRMHATGGRVILPELLDDEEGRDKRASLGDLVRIGRYLGGHRVLRGLMRRVTSRDEEFSILDVGSASGDSAGIIRSVRRAARVTSFDYRMEHLAGAPYPKAAGDAFRLPFRDGSFDFVLCSLFLHHFENDAIVELLRSFGAVARSSVLVTDLERGPGAYYFMAMSQWLFRWNRITMHDAPASVEAAFRKSELESLARQAGFTEFEVRRHRPWARLSLVAKV